MLRSRLYPCVSSYSSSTTAVRVSFSYRIGPASVSMLQIAYWRLTHPLVPNSDCHYSCSKTQFHHSPQGAGISRFRISERVLDATCHLHLWDYQGTRAVVTAPKHTLRYQRSRMLRNTSARLSSKAVSGSRRWKCSGLSNHLGRVVCPRNGGGVVCSVAGRRYLLSSATSNGEGVDAATRRPKLDLFNPSEVRYSILPLPNKHNSCRRSYRRYTCLIFVGHRNKTKHTLQA